MAGPDTLEVSGTNLDDFKQGVSMVDFTATWCGPCQVLGPIVDKLATEFSGKVKIGKCDIDKNPDIAGAFGVMGVPTLVFFKNGEVVDQHVGLLAEAALRDKLSKMAG
ncbi:MAG: thioredoxin [Planctomycetes bacterium]|nr:thioredoxin [Planctomycetota bacterium]